MGKKHYSGKELLQKRQMEKRQQQGGSKQTIRQRVQEMNRLKQTMEAARQGMRKRAREGKGNDVSD